MYATTVVSGGPAPRRKSARRAQDRIGAAEFGVFPFQLADPRRVPARGPWSLPGIDLGPLHPAAERVAVDSQLPADPPARRRGIARLLLDVEHEADRPLPQLIWILPWCWHDSIL